MSERQERLQNRLQPEIREFRDGCRTLQLATVDGEGNPNASYAPFVLQEDGYYVLISEIARHARNLQQVPKVSLMLIEDETGAVAARLGYGPEPKASEALASAGAG